MSFFGKKLQRETKPPAVTQAAPKPAVAAPVEPIVITGVGVITHAGDQPFGLLGAVAAPIGIAKPSKHLEARSLQDRSAVPVYTCEIAGLPRTDPAECLFLLLAAVLMPLLEEALESGEKCLLYCAVPDPRTARGEAIDPRQWKTKLCDLDLRFESIEMRFASDVNSAQALAQCVQELREGKWRQVLFGGVDSLVDIHTCGALADRLMTTKTPDGLIPGEAAAFLVLETEKQARQNPPTRIWATIRGMSFAPEPNGRDADDKTVTGLVRATQASLSQAQLSASDIDAVVFPLGAEQVGHFEWYQVNRALWPRRISEQQRLAVQLGEIADAEIPADPTPEILRPYVSLGEIGAATLPVSLALACARFEFEHPKAEHILVCEAGDAPTRGAILLAAPNAPAVGTSANASLTSKAQAA